MMIINLQVKHYGVSQQLSTLSAKTQVNWAEIVFWKLKKVRRLFRRTGKAMNAVLDSKVEVVFTLLFTKTPTYLPREYTVCSLKVFLQILKEMAAKRKPVEGTSHEQMEIERDEDEESMRQQVEENQQRECYILEMYVPGGTRSSLLGG
ncbi:hypothetical protein KP509_21G036800 [Ceratopteris richardii]|uniref:Uncharacterized protein n=1 Tax=Ceratopteris richardii TaxID=49495 RepID=A0A8T2SC36_CERRI|nr:hypothetical protein KP509_21G036800 [Ceratopteris richardii]